jgi:hypothetical protein
MTDKRIALERDLRRMQRSLAAVRSMSCSPGQSDEIRAEVARWARTSAPILYAIEYRLTHQGV